MVSVSKTLMFTLTLFDLSGKFKLCKLQEVSYHESWTALFTSALTFSLAEKSHFIASWRKQISHENA